MGNVTLGLKLGPGKMPNTPLVPGQKIQLIGLTGKNTTTAVVAALPEKLADGATWLLDVSLPLEDAPAVAALAAVDQLVLIALQES